MTARPTSCRLCHAAFSVVALSLANSAIAAPPQLEWRRLPDLPDPHGVAGPLVGVHEDALIVAGGGANFPDGLPWHPTADGGKSLKHYLDTIYLLEKTAEGESARSVGGDPVEIGSRYRWRTAEAKLPHPIAYCVCIPTPQGVLGVGGEWQTHERTAAGDVASTVHRSRDVFLVRVDAKTRQVRVLDTWPIGEGDREREVRLPQLPVGLTAAAGGRVGDAIYIAGGDTGEGGSSIFWRLDLTRANQRNWAWELLSSWDGPPRTHAVAVSHGGALYLCSGRSRLAGQGFRIHTDAHRYDPDAGWQRLPDITADGDPRCVMAGCGHSLGEATLAIFGGASGEILLRKERDIPKQIEQAQQQNDPERVATLAREATRLYDEHPGFSRDILTFDTRTNRWSSDMRMPVTSPVTTTAVSWNNAVVIASGERAPGVRTRDVWLLEAANR